MHVAAAALVLVAGLAPFAAQAAESSALYDTHCALCHQRGGAGAPGQFPRLAGRIATIAADARGRAYLVSVVRNGLSGSISVDGTTLTGLMPPLPQLEAQEVATILNYLASLPPAPKHKPQRFSAAEVTTVSQQLLPPQQLPAERQSLVNAGVIP